MKEIKPFKNIDARIEVPGSKSITQRALIAAALAKGDSLLRGPLASDDTLFTAKALRAVGVKIRKNKRAWRVSGNNGQVMEPEKKIFLGNNGTATRFLTSVASLGHGVFTITGEKRMEERPIQPLLEALSGWGVSVRSIKDTGCPPLEIRASGIRGGLTVLPEGKSSQYLSSLLLVAPYAAHRAKLEVLGEVYSRPYVKMTLSVMKSFGIKVIAKKDLSYFEIPRGRYYGRDYQIEGDASSASYFWAAAAVTGGRVEVVNVPKKSIQGDTVLVQILASMGCKVHYRDSGILVEGVPELNGVDVDMADCPDVVPTLAVVAARAKGRTVIRNIGHLRIKECDRLHVMATELAKLGVRTEEGPDYLVVEGQGAAARLNGAEIDTHDDHRIAMSFAVAGLFVPGIKIMDEGVVAKSFPDFWERFAKLYGN